ncbi:MAG TPA: class I SAM-dependent methyltransferase [Pyrodictium sp.]|nr:class I SAM-dependent methyltransferase [Pyrodictium sp.]
MCSHYFRRGRRFFGGFRVVSEVLRGVGFEFIVSGGVFSSKGVDEGTRLLIEYADVPEEGLLLDLGCGYGVIGIVFAKLYPKLRVYMVDVNSRAVELARLNAKHNNVADRVVVLQGNLYEPVKGLRFNVILSNPPLAAGMNTIEAIVRQAPEYLVKGGSLQLVLRKGSERVKSIMEEVFGNCEVVVRKKGYTVLKSIIHDSNN